jgi:hypothetical protein
MLKPTKEEVAKKGFGQGQNTKINKIFIVLELVQGGELFDNCLDG